MEIYYKCGAMKSLFAQEIQIHMNDKLTVLKVGSDYF